MFGAYADDWLENSLEKQVSMKSLVPVAQQLLLSPRDQILLWELFLPPMWGFSMLLTAHEGMRCNSNPNRCDLLIWVCPEHCPSPSLK